MMKWDGIKDIVRDLQNGKMVIVMDDEKRENEGDLIMAASKVRPQHINFMVKYGRGLVCVPMGGKRLEKLGLYSMSSEPQDPYKTAWVISVDARRGVSTGISAEDRALTISLLAKKGSKSGDFIKPGHVFPLRAQEGGVLVRAGHTEACVDLMGLAGLDPVGVI